MTMPPDRPPPAANERLDSWKEIAAYLGRGVRTVQRWEQSEGLPVRRLGQDRTGSVFAYKSELDTWWKTRSRQLNSESDVETSESPAPVKRGNVRLVVAAGVVTAAVAASLLALAVWPRKLEHRPVPFTSEHGTEIQPAFSPDGQQIAYVAISKSSPKGQIFIKSIGADSATRMTTAPGPERAPSWSPDGRLIAYFGDDGGAMAVNLISAQGGGGRTPIARFKGGGRLVWSADGKWLLGRYVGPDSVMANLARDHSPAWRGLAVSLLHVLVLGQLLGGTPQCRYVHLTSEVIEAASAKQCQLAVLVPPASMGHVESIAGNLEKMPPKSTYFYPKLLSGLVFHSLKTH